MKLQNEFTVDAPVDRTWQTLLDIERVATCLPGARIEPGDDDGVYRGAMKVKVGPMTVDYRGTARLQDVDEDTRTASIVVQAREAKGQGTAAAVIRNQLEARNGSTHVSAETDLKLTGRQAQFGRGIVEDVAGAMMSDFAKRLELELQGEGAPSGEKPPAVRAGETAAAATEEPEEALDLGGVLLKSPVARQAGIIGALVLGLLALLLVLRRPRRRITFNIDLSR
ncbi:MAG: SRPBCC family protein [Solirubrobacterales bacterium]